MNDIRFIPDDVVDDLTEWLVCRCPQAVEDKELLRGIFFLCDEAIREAVVTERERSYQHLLHVRFRN